MGRRRRLPADPFPIQIASLAENGRGVGVHDDRRLEVYDSLTGEVVSARYLFGRRFKGQARAVEILEPSAERTEPACIHFGTCSACSLQHLEPARQIAHKQEWLLRYFQQQDGLEPESVLPPLQSDLWHYRRKARLSVRKVEAKGRVLVGFRERDSRFVTDTETCHILPKRISDRIPALCALIDSMAAAGSIPQIEVTCGDDHCALIVRHLEPLAEADIDRLEAFARKEGLAILTQGGGPDTIRALGADPVELSYRLPEFGLEFRFGPLDFVQVNAALNQLMIRQALDLLELQKEDKVLELFCGLGNFSLPLAQYCGSVSAFEGDQALVSRARSNASHNGVNNVCFEQADLYQQGDANPIPTGAYDKVLLDPPRSGAGPVLQAISDCGATRVVYVSCNPATLAADAALLVREHGYNLVSAGVMDMFPHTTHVESMALFVRD